MISINMLLDMIATEAITPDTHQCQKCGLTFSPNEDGCPNCGTDAPVTLLPELEKTRDIIEP